MVSQAEGGLLDTEEVVGGWVISSAGREFGSLRRRCRPAGPSTTHFEEDPVQVQSDAGSAFCDVGGRAGHPAADYRDRMCIVMVA